MTPSLDSSQGGPARSVPQLASALSALGHEVSIFTPEVTEERIADNYDIGAAGVSLVSGSFRDAVVRFNRPDIVHTHGIWMYCHREAARVCLLENIPRVVSPRGMLEPWSLRQKLIKKKLAWYLYQRNDLRSASAIHATAQSEAENICELGGFSDVFVVPNGVTKPPELHLNRDDFAGQNNDRKKVLLFLGRIHPKKGLPLLVEAWARIRPKDWTVRVVGSDDGGHINYIRNAVRQAGCAQDWSFDGPKEGLDKWRSIADADLFILPSHSENFGIVVAEALAAKLPVITTTATPWNGLRDNNCGWWVEPTVDAIEKALLAAMKVKPKELREMGVRGSSWVESNFLWPGVAKSMAAKYEDILSR
ncbi:MAG: glycosyltransferase [Pseudomonadales bacterium]